MKLSRAGIGLFSLVFVLAMASPSRAAEDAETEVRNFVQGFLNAVTNLDVSQLGKMYAPGPATTFVRNGTITYGWDAIQHQAQSAVGIALRDSFEVTAEDVKVTFLGPQNAYVITPINLTVQTPVGNTSKRGALTLVLEKRAGKWLILHEHRAMNCAP
jgi:ketosteroid isomerase-like protein